ncbi:MAG: DUF389 domain-containing protein [Methanomicrobiales archaeon]
MIASAGGPTTVTVYVSNNLIDNFLSRLKDLPGFRNWESIIEVSSLNFVIAPLLEEKKTMRTPSREKQRKSPPSKSSWNRQTPHTILDADKVILAGIAVVVALIGLFLNTIGIIIGAMLISPLLEPIYAFTVNTATGDSKKVLDCLKVFAAIILMVIAISFVTTYLLSLVMAVMITPKISSRPINLLC